MSGSTGRARRSRVVIGVLVLAAGAILAIVLHGSIGSGSSEPLRSRIDAVLSVMRATSVQVRVVQTTAQADPKSETVVGVVDLRRGRSRYTVPLFYGPQGQRLHPPGTAQFISVGRSVYADVLPDPTIPADAQRNKHWIEQTVPSGYDPTGVLGDLTSMRDSHASRDLGTTELDGHLVHHYQAVFHPAAKTATTRLLSLRASVSDVYIDAENQVVRLVERDTIGTDTSTRQSDFSNYGIHIDIVVPPADQVILYTDEYPPAPHLTGAWNLAASGHTDGVAWHLYRAPADHERACWTFESTPPLDIGPLVANFNGPALRHDGHEATCLRSGVWLPSGVTKARFVVVVALAVLLSGRQFGIWGSWDPVSAENSSGVLTCGFALAPTGAHGSPGLRDLLESPVARRAPFSPERLANGHSDRTVFAAFAAVVMGTFVRT